MKKTLLLLAAFVAFPALAVDLGPTFQWLTSQTVSAGVESIGPVSTGRALVAVGTPTMVTDGSNVLRLTRTGSMLNPSGVPVPLVYKSAIAAGTAAAIIVKALPLVSTLSTGVALYDLAKELSFDFGHDAAGLLTVTKAVPILNWTSNYAGFNGGNAWPTPQEACDHVQHGTYSTGPTATLYSGTPGTVGVKYGCWSLQITVTSVNAGSPVSSTMADLEDAIASKSGWPAGSKIAQAAYDAINLTHITPAEIPSGSPANSPTVTINPTSTGPSEVTTKSNPDGSTETTTKSPSYRHTSSGDKVTTSQTTNTTVQTCTGAGSCSSTTSVTTKTPDPVQTDCEKNPSSIGCLGLGTPDAPKVPNKVVPFSSNKPTFASSAGCPTSPSFTVFGHSYAISFQPMCDLMVYMRAIFLLCFSLGAAMIMADSFRVS